MCCCRSSDNALLRRVHTLPKRQRFTIAGVSSFMAIAAAVAVQDKRRPGVLAIGLLLIVPWFRHTKCQQSAAGDGAADHKKRDLPWNVINHHSQHRRKQERNSVTDRHRAQILRMFVSRDQFKRIVGNCLHRDGSDSKKDIGHPKPLSAEWKPRRRQQYSNQCLK